MHFNVDKPARLYLIICQIRYKETNSETVTLSSSMPRLDYIQNLRQIDCSLDLEKRVQSPKVN